MDLTFGICYSTSYLLERSQQIRRQMHYYNSLKFPFYETLLLLRNTHFRCDVTTLHWHIPGSQIAGNALLDLTKYAFDYVLFSSLKENIALEPERQ